MGRELRLANRRTKTFSEPGAIAVVFVHGLRGHFLRTWGKFPQLLEGDPDLPKIGICSWGYQSWLLPWDPDLETEARRFLSNLPLLTEDTCSLFLVGHSMGGLLILSAAVQAAKSGQARRYPCSHVRWISLYATPIMGNMAAAVLKMTLGWVSLLRLLSPHIRDLARGGFVDRLIGDVVEHIYRPSVSSGDENFKRQIPIRANVGSRDSVVTYDASASIFKDPPPILLEADHRTVKLPESRRDLRYRSLKQDLEHCLTNLFQDLCARCMAPDEQVRTEAQLAFYAQYRRLLGVRLAQAYGLMDSRRRRELEEMMSVLVWKLGARRQERPAKTFDEALMLLRRRDS